MQAVAPATENKPRSPCEHLAGAGVNAYFEA